MIGGGDVIGMILILFPCVRYDTGIDNKVHEWSYIHPHLILFLDRHTPSWKGSRPPITMMIIIMTHFGTVYGDIILVIWMM
jgi:hypothetical protein